ncbi:MAG: polysaccharide deacetylase family protein [Anaerolineales bacterium]
MSSIRKATVNLVNRAFPSVFWRKYGRLARKAGINHLYIILSYDCDTQEDIPASAELFEWLRARDIPATFAVPGPQLKQGKDVYRRLQDLGARFINHGGAPHTKLMGGRYESTTFYDRMRPHEVKADIREGHQIFSDVLGHEPSGFRAPHFGHFQKPHQLGLIYDTLRMLDSYRYSTTTAPASAWRSGPIYAKGQLWEIPVLGSYYWPLRIFDSWGHRESKITRQARDTYARELTTTVDRLTTKRFPALLNYYADPSHINKNKAYFTALEYARDRGAIFIDYETIIALAESQRTED